MIIKRIIPAMMIFLFLMWFVMPVKELSAQKNEVPDGMMPVTRIYTFKEAQGPLKEADKPGNKDYEPAFRGTFSASSAGFSPRKKALAQQYLSNQDRAFGSQGNGSLILL